MKRNRGEKEKEKEKRKERKQKTKVISFFSLQPSSCAFSLRFFWPFDPLCVTFITFCKRVF
jgi:hypothetical protein